MQLLEGIKGAALKNDVDVDVLTLFGYAADRVPTLAKGIGGIQKPLPLEPSGRSFPIGEIDSADKLRIPLAVPMPVILAPRFMDPIELSDNLSLEPAVSAKLRDATDANARGGAGTTAAVFVPADDMPGAIRPSGTYTVGNGQVTVKLGLIRDGKLITSKIVEGSTTDTSVLASKIVDTILGAAKTLTPAVSSEAAAPSSSPQ